MEKKTKNILIVSSIVLMLIGGVVVYSVKRKKDGEINIFDTISDKISDIAEKGEMDMGVNTSKGIVQPTTTANITKTTTATAPAYSYSKFDGEDLKGSANETYKAIIGTANWIRKSQDSVAKSIKNGIIAEAKASGLTYEQMEEKYLFDAYRNKDCIKIVKKAIKDDINSHVDYLEKNKDFKKDAIEDKHIGKIALLKAKFGKK